MATETTKGRLYTPEFKATAVQMHYDGDPIEDVAAALDVSVPVLRTWVLLDEVANPSAPARTQAPSRLPAPVSKAPAAVRAAQPMAAGAPMQQCMVCGRGPARVTTLRSVTGIVIAFRMRRIRGTFCRDCGVAMARRTQNRTLLAGWWGLFAGVANLFALGVNGAALDAFRRLPAPTGTPSSPPLPPGRSLFQRAGVYVAAVAMVASFVVGFAVVGTRANPSAFNGKCVAFDTAKVIAKPTCGSSHDGRVVAVVGDKFQCPEATDATARLRASDGKVLCIDLDQ
jgi:transposase-like protein